MKVYKVPNHYRIVGKAWEVKYQLQKIVSEANDRSVTLQSILNQKTKYS